MLAGWPARFGRVLDEFDDLPFGNAADLIQMEPPLAFLFFGIHSRTQERINDHGQRSDRRATHRKHYFPISKQGLQRMDSLVSAGRDCAHHAKDCACAVRRKDFTRPPMPH